MEATKTSGNSERSEKMSGFKHDKKDSSFEMIGQSSGSEDKTNAAEQTRTADVSPSPGMDSEALASENTSKSREQCHIRLRRKTLSLPNKHLEYDLQLSEGLPKKEQKSVKTGKYVCQYCGRACAKPSVLKKHIRSHTGERPYPCIPCGFSFKTKSNLYKHRKSHTHAVKAGLVPYSEQDSKRADEESTVVEGEMHSDAEQSTDTDEEVVEESSLDTTTHVKDTESFIQEKGKKLAKKEDVMLYTPSSLKRETTKVSLWQFREMTAPPAIAQTDQMVEFSTIKQRLALRLSEKKSQDSEHSLSLPSSYSKGSTDSGYFSRSESAEQQFNPSSSSAKSYQEIMFGKCYRPTTRPKQSITVQTCMTDINEATSSFMIKLNRSMKLGETESCIRQSKKDLVRSLKFDSESFQEEDYQECQIPDAYQGSSDLLETPLESSMFSRSNSLPTSTNSNLNAPQGLRSSNSFDERMTAGDVTYRGAVGIRRLMRQGAFEHSAIEGHAESDCYAHLSCSLKSELKIHNVEDSKMAAENYQEAEICMASQSQLSETSTRKRRKDKSVMEEEDFHIQHKSSHVPEARESGLETSSDTERRAGSNVISVIQHTNKLNWSNTSEKPTDIRSHTSDKVAICKFTEHSIEGHRNDTNRSSERIDWQWGSSVNPKPHMIKQVPEIRVTVEPDRPVKVPDQAFVKQREKHAEEFQWPQRSETLSQFPVEKLPPKKKRLRLAEMECSSGESSFESACTSLSRSPSQDSNLSYSSSFSQSLDREEILNVASQSNSDECNKPLEFLSVPAISQSHHREMRRSASEQAPYNLPTEVSEFRSKSFDYGSLSPSSTCRQEDVKERRRGFLVRQASLRGEPDVVQGQDKSLNVHVTQDATSSDEVNKRQIETTVERMRFSGSPFQQHKPVSPVQTSSDKHYTQPNVGHVQDVESIMHLIKKEPEGFQAAETHISLRNPQEDCSQNLGNVLSTIAVLSHAQQALASQRMSGLLVPVRIQMQVPSYGSITYTSISHILDSQTQSPISCLEHKSFTTVMPRNNTGCEPSQMSGQVRGRLSSPQASPAKLNTGIPLSLTSKTISTTEAPSGGANKRMLSPASSIELFIEAKQQKRVKDENIYGQIVKELSAVELGNLESEKERPKEGIQSAIPQESLEHSEEVDMDEVNLDSYHNPKLQSPASISRDAAMMECKPTPDRTLATHTAVGAMATEITGALLFPKFPGLHTTTCVSWCYLNSTKPNSIQTAAHFSEYASWLVRCHNPNPPNLSTGMVLALLRSKQGRQSAVYTIATMYQPGLLVTSTPWRPKQEQLTLECNDEEMKHDVRLRDIGQRCKSVREDVALSVRQPEPSRVKIFEGGYKSNEEYVYVRGRGRGKYICEECGIRCKKPSMLKKHIRTHTDVRPYVCKCCNFAFKTKGNLTKHMKSKSHMKKCLELGVSPTAIDNTEDADDIQKSLCTRPVDTTIKHQFSDVEDSDGADEDGDEPDDEEDDECDGDSTPRTLSRSTSPQPYAVNKPFLSSRATKHPDTSRDPPKEQLEVSSPSFEDDLILELCPPQLLSPCWDSPRQRYMYPRGDLSPQRHLLSSCDSSPLRAVSPRRDLSVRGDFSPLRQLSPVRPAGSDPTGQRAQSPLGRHKGVLRAASPRRGSYHYRAHVDQGRSVRFQTSPHRPVVGVCSEVGTDQGDAPLFVPLGLCSHKTSSATLQPDILSHLPLHSQGPLPTPVPMIPIGGLRMPSTSSPGAAGERNSLQSPPQGNISERPSSSRTSAPVPDPGEPHASLPKKDDKKEESVSICAKAIASLRITSEDATDQTPKS